MKGDFKTLSDQNQHRIQIKMPYMIYEIIDCITCAWNLLPTERKGCMK